jgi:RNA-binding protein
VGQPPASPAAGRFFLYSRAVASYMCAFFMSLTGKQRRHLRALGHNLTAVVQIGKEGLSASFIAAVDQALADHELIKIKLGQNAEVELDEAAATLATQTTSQVAQILGKTILLYRPHPEEPQIRLP